jgi:hypothetical protein
MEDPITLSEFVGSLTSGSLCFCCGSNLVARIDEAGSLSLDCSGCGATVSAERPVLLAQAA